MSGIASAADPVRDSGGLMRLLVSRLLIGLLVSGWLSVDFGRGTANLALELIPGLLEFSQALAETTGKLGKAFLPRTAAPRRQE